MSGNIDSFRTIVLNHSKINLIYQNSTAPRSNYTNNRSTATSMDDLVPPRLKKSVKTSIKPASPNDNPVHSWTALCDENSRQPSIKIPSYAESVVFPESSSEYTPSKERKRESFTRSQAPNTQQSNIDLSNQQQGRTNNWVNTWQNINTVNLDHASVTVASTTASPSPSSSTKTRSRDNTDDPLGFVKYTPATSRFEDIQSEAFNSWEEGVDLRLENSSKSKKRVEWLSQSDFFSNDVLSPKTEKESAFEPPQTTIQTRPHPNESSQVKQILKKSLQASPAPIETRKQSYAEVADKMTPAWAIENNEIASIEKYNYQQTTGLWAQTMVQQTPNMQQMAPVVMVPSPYMSMPSGYHPISMQPNAVNTTQDVEFLLYFYSIIHQSNTRNAISAFQKKIEQFVHQRLHEMSSRTFGLFLQCLTITMDYESGRSEFETARKIFSAWDTLMYYFKRFIQTYTQLPEDLLVVLSFSATMVRFFPLVSQDLPIPDILRIFDNVKKLISSDSRSEFIKLLRDIKAIPVEDVNDQTWQDLENSLPDVPVAETIISEVINQTNALASFEKKKDITIVNNIHRPWPNVNLLNYALFHFMALRDEFIGPIQKVIQELFKGNVPSSIHIPECAMFEQTVPVSTTMAISTTESCIVFKLGSPRDGDDIMKSFEEGSFVVLLPEITALSTLNRHTLKKKTAENSMVGQVIRASSYSANSNTLIRLVSIHIPEDHIHKLNWDKSYTMITSSINACSTLSTLHWLRDQYTNLKKKNFSSVLAPRILAAKNTLTKEQISSWDEEHYERDTAINEDPIPDYLADANIDISCIMAKNGSYHARPGDNVWPRHASQWDDIPLAKRPPLYKVSPSQLEAIKFALTHRISVISGAPGTGKTYLVSKLAQLMSQALIDGQFHQPILILTKSQSTLDDILSNILPQIPDMVRFGGEPWVETLQAKQATRLAAPALSDNNYRQYQSLERQIVKNQAALNALIVARSQVKHHDPEVFSGIIAPTYLVALEKGFIQSHPNSHYSTINNIAIWKAWTRQDARTRDYHKAQESRNAIVAAQWALENNYLKHAGRGILPIVDPNIVRNRFSTIANNKAYISSISEAVNWPFNTSMRSGASLRSALLDEWKRVPVGEIWNLDADKRSKLIQSLANVLINYIDSEIEDTLQKQIKIAKMCNEILVQKWTYLCRFNRIIGMTAEFAAAHRDWVSTLWPRAVIVDEASDILESTIASSILGPRTEHVVLLGVSDELAKPKLTNPNLAGNPRHLDVSLFERWKSSTSEMILLEEQWRMHSDVADVIDQFNSTKKAKDTSLLITAPLASCNENMVDGKYPNLEPLYGITKRAFYMKYQANSETSTDIHYSKVLRETITKAEIDEARFVAFFAVYLSQQPYATTNITILTVCLLQKYLIRTVLREEVPKRTCFKSNVSKIKLDTVEQYRGRQDNFTIVSTATPSYAVSHYDNLSHALTRAKYGLFVIGKPGQDRVHARWHEFATYMEDRQLAGEAIQLTCHAHGDTLFASCWQDFDQMRNGGCSRPCATLMSDGHVCKEVCHFMNHNEIVCQEPCNRIRPSNCSHQCQKKCFECSKQGSCPPCTENSSVKLECGHELVGVCHSLQNTDQIKCQEQVQASLKCGHQLSIECFKAQKIDKIQCQVKTTSILACGHTVTTRCGLEPMCPELCNKVLECGHKCDEICGVPHTHNREDCTASCPKQLICGHGCAKGCANPDEHTERCMEKCNYICSHKYKCSRECWRDCIRCISECPYQCKHYRCAKKCYEICDRPPCNEPCRKQLGCTHRCSGLCGEPCPPCSLCYGNKKCSISLRTLSEFEPKEAVYMLPECQCVFSVEALDMYFKNQAKNGEHTAIKLWECPTCQKTIYTALRYNKYIKTEISLVNTIKMRLEQERQRLTHHEREQIISAMNDETRHHAIHNIVGGRWFVCQNQHPYYVGDCGGATEVSKCPECDAPIGGTQHKVVESNRFYGEFDGSEKPAWPGQPGQINQP